MTRIAQFLFTGSFLLLSTTAILKAQILNGSFATGNFTDWNTLGAPHVVTSLTPPSGTTQAWVQSTSGDTGAISVTAAAIDSTLGVTLPPTNGAGTAYPGTWNPTNGQAIYQSFTLGQSEKLTFAWAFQTNDNVPFDSAGYVLDGVYTQLAAPTLPYYDSPDPTPTAYVTLAPITLTAGAHTLAFVAYNTGDNTASTSLYVTDISLSVAPEPSAWGLMAMGGIALLVLRRRVSFRS